MNWWKLETHRNAWRRLKELRNAKDLPGCSKLASPKVRPCCAAWTNLAVRSNLHMRLCPSLSLFPYLFLCIVIILSLSRSVYLSGNMYFSLSICISIYLSIYPSIYLSSYLSIYLSIHPSFPSIHPSNPTLSNPTWPNRTLTNSAQSNPT